MRASNQLIPLADARPGMVLGEVLCDSKGQVLLAQGTVLTDAVLASLSRHGVAAVAIQGPGADPIAPAPALDPAIVEERLARLFRKHGQPGDGGEAGRASASLRQYISRYRLGRGVQA